MCVSLVPVLFAIASSMSNKLSKLLIMFVWSQFDKIPSSLKQLSSPEWILGFELIFFSYQSI